MTFKGKLASVLIATLLIGTAFASYTMRAVNDNQLRWKDINIGTNILSGPPGLLPDVENFVDENGADTGISSLGIAVGEGTGGYLEIQHDYAEGTDISFHLHWQGITIPAGGTDNVQWQLTYTFSKDDTTLDPVTVITKETAFTTQYEFVESTFSVITGTNIKAGDQFMFTIERIAASADEYAGDAITVTIGVHYQVDDRGSREVEVK